jgi:hypothetical protein
MDGSGVGGCGVPFDSDVNGVVTAVVVVGGGGGGSVSGSLLSPDVVDSKVSTVKLLLFAVVKVGTSVVVVRISDVSLVGTNTGICILVGSIVKVLVIGCSVVIIADVVFIVVGVGSTLLSMSVVVDGVDVDVGVGGVALVDSNNFRY